MCCVVLCLYVLCCVVRVCMCQYLSAKLSKGKMVENSAKSPLFLPHFPFSPKTPKQKWQLKLQKPPKRRPNRLHRWVIQQLAHTPTLYVQTHVKSMKNLFILRQAFSNDSISNIIETTNWRLLRQTTRIYTHTPPIYTHNTLINGDKQTKRCPEEAKMDPLINTTEKERQLKVRSHLIHTLYAH